MTSLDTYNAKVIVGMDDLKRGLSTRKIVKVRVVCYCSPFGLSCNFRVTNKLLEIMAENQIGITDTKDFIGSCELEKLRRHLTLKHTGKYILRPELTRVKCVMRILVLHSKLPGRRAFIGII